MPNSYTPTPETIQAHLRHVQATAGQSWSRERSLHLLLGLRDPVVDRNLIEIGRTKDMPGGSSQLHRADIVELANDSSIHRIVRLVTQHFDITSLAWLTPTEGEVSELIAALSHHRAGRAKSPKKPSWGRALIERVMDRRGQADFRESTSLGSPVLFASLCNLVERFASCKSLNALDRFTRNSWLERMEWQRVSRAPTESPRLTSEQMPVWLPELPPPLIRDPLTGLLSRSVLCKRPDHYRLENEQDFAELLPTPELIMTDVDHMLRINDAYGHVVGGSVLRRIAEELQQVVGDRVIRIGGDEQLVLWEFGEAKTVAQTIVEAIRALEIPNPDNPTKAIHVTVSAAVAGGTEALDVFRALDDCMERAKVAGRDRVEIA